jgi:hypothetical protein
LASGLPFRNLIRGTITDRNAVGGSITRTNIYNEPTTVLVITAQFSGMNAAGPPFTGTLTVENGRASRSILKTRPTFVREDR